MGPCMCGDAYDEHEEGGLECTIQGCSCVMYEEGEEEDDPA